MLLYVGLKYKRKRRAWEDMGNTARNRVISEATRLFHPYAHGPNQFYVSTEITGAGKCIPQGESLPNDNSLRWKGECYSLEASAHLQPLPHSQSQCVEFFTVDRRVYKQKELNAFLDLLQTAWFWLPLGWFLPADSHRFLAMVTRSYSPSLLQQENHLPSQFYTTAPETNLFAPILYIISSLNKSVYLGVGNMPASPSLGRSDGIMSTTTPKDFKTEPILKLKEAAI